MFGAVRFGTLSTRPLPPSSPSTPATQPQTTPNLTPPGGAGGGGAGGGETVRFGATKQARFGTVPVRFGTILQESIVETPMIILTTTHMLSFRVQGLRDFLGPARTFDGHLLYLRCVNFSNGLLGIYRAQVLYQFPLWSLEVCEGLTSRTCSLGRARSVYGEMSTLMTMTDPDPGRMKPEPPIMVLILLLCNF